jgi:hypothetical protein
LIGALLGSYYQYAVHKPHDSEKCVKEIDSPGNVSFECQYAAYLNLPEKLGNPALKVV